jgi:hypothetical protein
MAVVLLGSDIKIPAIDVKFWTSQKTYHTHIISILFEKFTSWQEKLSPYLENFTPIFCDEIQEAERAD